MQVQVVGAALLKNPYRQSEFTTESDHTVHTCVRSVASSSSMSDASLAISMELYSSRYCFSRGSVVHALTCVAAAGVMRGADDERDETMEVRITVT